MKKYRVIGVMSGTSLDGLDIALCTFENKNDKWNFHIEKSDTVSYNKVWKERLAHAQRLSSYEFIQLHREYGVLLGQKILSFIKDIKNIDFIASHGHTVFHEPDNNISFQIGCGAQIAAITSHKVISDFRTFDIALGGQGAPLVPIGDKLLFSDYDGCINLGGFANISFDNNDIRYAFDICPINIITNDIVYNTYKLPFDDEGKIGKEGNVITSLLNELNKLPFYNKEAPKSLAREWIETTVNPILNKYDSYNAKDVLATLYQHYTTQITKVIDTNKLQRVLFTGGGTLNTHLINLIKEQTKATIDIPNKEIIDFKEALIFAFLGVLKHEGKINCLKSVTGASKDSCGGSIFGDNTSY